MIGTVADLGVAYHSFSGLIVLDSTPAVPPGHHHKIAFSLDSHFHLHYHTIGADASAMVVYR